MILEALEFATTPCPRWARRLGYLSEAIAIRHRARRCRDAWAPHLEATRAAILKKAPERATEIVVLGAGLCHDIPLQALAKRCRRLTLVDAVRLRFGPRLPTEARYLTLDVHGAAEAIHDGRAPWPRGPSPLRRFDTADAVFSVNLLSQLPLLPLRALRQRGSPDPETAVAEDRILREHVADLQDLPGQTVLIADAERRRKTRAGRWETDALAERAGLPAPIESWRWSIAPPGETADGTVWETTVGVWTF